MMFREKSISKLYAFALAAVFALTLAGCGGGGGGTAEEPPPPMPTPQETCEAAGNNWVDGACLTDAQVAFNMCVAGGGRDNGDGSCTSAADVAQEQIMAARDAADAAAGAAEMAADAQTANMSADAASYTLARNAAERARAASDAAAATDDVAEAQRLQGVAEAEQANAEMYAGMVADAQQAIDDENQRQMDVMTARGNASTSYMNADGDADKAEAAAAEAEATAGVDSPGAVAARAAATKAREQADAAKAALDAITDDMTKAQADAKAEEAATAAGHANSYYMTAKDENDTIQTAADIGEQQQEARDLADAQREAQELYDDAADGVTFHYDAVVQKAADARTQANNARAAANRAALARTDAATADAEATKAEMAADEAEAALARAMTAKQDADNALQAAKDATTSAAAKAALEDLKTANAALTEEHTGATGAGMDYMAAKAAAEAAMTASGNHVLRLFMAANGAHVEDNEDTEANETAVHVASVGTAIATNAAVASGDQTGSTTATATWAGNNVDDPATENTDESTNVMLSIMVSPNGGDAIPFELRESRAATDLNGDGDMTDDGEGRIIQTARKIADLGVFDGYELWEDDGDATTNTDRARAIVFTNKQKGDDQVREVTLVPARSVTNQTVQPGELDDVTSTGTTITGVEWTPPGQAPLTGTLTCTGDSCSITLGADGAVTAIEGYTFTGSRAGREAVTAAAATEDNDYMMFGIWLDETADGATDTFGAFMTSGAGYAVNVQDAVTGTATYSGMAAGAHHKTGEGVNFFSGVATLTANFGAIDTDAERGTTPPADTTAGTISGEISNIRVNGGAAMSDSIVLGQAGLTDGTATFNGAARMGAAEIQADGTTVEYPFNGTWSGSFFGATADDPDTDANESVTAPLAAAGTFGVTMSEGTGDDMVVESFVGAFGAEKQ